MDFQFETKLILFILYLLAFPHTNWISALCHWYQHILTNLFYNLPQMYTFYGKRSFFQNLKQRKKKKKKKKKKSYFCIILLERDISFHTESTHKEGCRMDGPKYCINNIKDSIVLKEKQINLKNQHRFIWNIKSYTLIIWLIFKFIFHFKNKIKNVFFPFMAKIINGIENFQESIENLQMSKSKKEIINWGSRWLVLLLINCIKTFTH